MDWVRSVDQISAMSPLLFIIMINDIFSKIPVDIRRSLFADDGALEKRWEHGACSQESTRSN